jgi:hypothetical protein
LAPGGEQRTHDRTDFGRGLKERFDLAIKSSPPTGAGQQAERLQHTADHVGKPRRHPYELSASSEESSRAMRIERFDVDRPIPSCAHDLRQTFGVVLIGLVDPHLQCGLNAAGIQTLHIKPLATHAMNEPGRHRSGLDTHFGVPARVL